MESSHSERLQTHVNAAIREILGNYENGLGNFCYTPLDATGGLAFELSAVIETLPQARLRERLLAEVRHLLRDPPRALVARELLRED
jgi:hypothetical protein